MITTKPRSVLIRELAVLIAVEIQTHPLRVAIDGIDASGKTMLADELIVPLQELGRPVIRASVDGFLNPRAFRYRLGANSPEGYYQDSFNYESILKNLLYPLGPGGSLRYRTSAYDYRRDTSIDEPLKTAPQDAVLLIDGVFLLRPELRSYWDYSVFVEVSFDRAVPRAVERDNTQTEVPEDQSEIWLKYQKRYIPGQKIYLETAQPKTYADIILDNNDLAHPILIHNKDLKSLRLS